MPPASRQTEPGGSPAQEVIQLLIAMSGRLSQHFAARAAEFELSAGEGKVLLALDTGETASTSMRALAGRLGLDASNLTGIVDRLEARGAVVRHPHPSDRRVKTIATTERGRQIGDRLSRRLRSDAGPVRSLTDIQLLQLRGLLELAMADEPAPE